MLVRTHKSMAWQGRTHKQQQADQHIHTHYTSTGGPTPSHTQHTLKSCSRETVCMHAFTLVCGVDACTQVRNVTRRSRPVYGSLVSSSHHARWDPDKHMMHYTQAHVVT